MKIVGLMLLLLWQVGCAVLFVTHYPQISSMVESVEPEASVKRSAINCHMSYIEGDDNDISFLYKAVRRESSISCHHVCNVVHSD